MGSPALSRLDLWRERRKGRERGKKLSKLSLAPFLANRNFITVVSVLKPFCILRKKMCQGDEHARLHHDPSSADNQQETMSSLEQNLTSLFQTFTAALLQGLLTAALLQGLLTADLLTACEQ